MEFETGDHQTYLIERRRGFVQSHAPYVGHGDEFQAGLGPSDTMSATVIPSGVTFPGAGNWAPTTSLETVSLKVLVTAIW